MPNTAPERIDVADGKYTVINDNGRLSALRHGEPWQDLTGNNLVYWLAVELRDARTTNQELLSLLKEAELFVRVLGLDSDPAAALAASCRAAIAKATKP